MALVVVLLVLVAAVLYIGPALLRSETRPVPAVDRGRKALADATSRRDAAYEALADLEFDYASGKIAQEDFARLKRQYQKAAVAALQDLERLHGRTDAEARERESA